MEPDWFSFSIELKLFTGPAYAYSCHVVRLGEKITLIRSVRGLVALLLLVAEYDCKSVEGR